METIEVSIISAMKISCCLVTVAVAGSSRFLRYLQPRAGPVQAAAFVAECAHVTCVPPVRVLHAPPVRDAWSTNTAAFG